MAETKELHVILDKDLHHKFMGKVRIDHGNTASGKVREWIQRFLRGELS